MEPDKNAVYAHALHATADEWRAAAKVCMDRLSEADDADAAEIKADAELYIKIAELLEEAGASCLLELKGPH